MSKLNEWIDATKMSFILEHVEVPVDLIEVGKIHTARIKVYTVKSAEDVKADFVELSQVLDVDRPMGNFLEAACCYLDFVKFELAEIED